MKDHSNPVFNFFEVVRVSEPTHLARHPTLQEGAIIGRAYWPERSTWLYTVYFPEQTLDFEESALISTGSMLEKSEVYDGTTIKVSSSGEPVSDGIS